MISLVPNLVFPRSDLRTFLKQRKVQVSLLALATIINTVLFGFCVDFVFKPFYFEKNYDLLVTRVGGVKSDSVKIFVRSPQVTQIHLEYRPTGSSSSSWNTCGAPAAVGPETDYTLSAECIGLSPSTRYEYRWISERDGQPLFSSQEMADMHFNTTPKINAPSKFNFAFTSCVKPGFPYGTKGLKGFREMGKQDLSFVLFLGDLIYADAPYLYGTDVDTYRWHYRYLYSQKDFSQTFSRIPLMSIYDDHEVLNNWEWETQQPYPAAFQAFNEYAGLTNPHHDANQTAVFDWSYGDVAFFVMDTREFRSFENQTMLGIEQKQRLKNWLLQVNATSSIKFLVSSVPFTQNWQWEHRDTWAGYLKERQEILDFIAENHIQNVMVISGDRHEVAITRLPGNVIEFSTSPLQAFYSPIDTYVETGDDEKIFTWRPGNVKWAMFSINTQAENPSAKYSLFVNDYQDSPIYEREFLLNPLR
ncbi:PhoD-like phosphatase-domain-containing protein [Phlyctochytrium arcticum]|nr:PhoD-like phosphatase-domain-containing protein [Phlyctochytrium arcticum]